MTINKEQAVSDAVLAKLAEKCAMACCSEAFPSTATFETRILKVLREHAASHPLEQQQAVSGDVVEQPGFVYFECGDCGFDSVQPADFDGSDYCPLCDGDNNRSNRMARRIARSTDRPEGKDARTALQGGE